MFSRIATRAVKPAAFSRPLSTTAFLASKVNQGSKGRQMPTSLYTRATAPVSGTEATLTIRVS